MSFLSLLNAEKTILLEKNFAWFLVLVSFFGLIGLVLGASLNQIVSYFQNFTVPVCSTNSEYDANLLISRFVAFCFGALQLGIGCLCYFIASKIIKSFPDWLFNSYVGYIFLLMYYIAQYNLSSNANILVHVVTNKSIETFN